jgi:hypothetical protein
MRQRDKERRERGETGRERQRQRQRETEGRYSIHKIETYITQAAKCCLEATNEYAGRAIELVGAPAVQAQG